MLEMILTIHGKVQGVGFRYSVIDNIESEQIIVRGYICNKPNGSVEIVAQGDIESLKDLRRIAVAGSDNSSIRDVEEVIQEIDEYTYDSFNISY
jgi:acylphosphatase